MIRQLGQLYLLILIYYIKILDNMFHMLYNVYTTKHFYFIMETQCLKNFYGLRSIVPD
jgi:hypothetical protein